MREWARSLKSSVRIIRGVHLLGGYRGDNPSGTRRRTRRRIRTREPGDEARGAFGKVEGIVIPRPGLPIRDGALIFTDVEAEDRVSLRRWPPSRLAESSARIGISTKGILRALS